MPRLRIALTAAVLLAAATAFASIVLVGANAARTR